MELELSLSPPYQKRQPIKKSCHDNDHRCSTVLRFPLVSWDQDEDDEHDIRFFNGDYQRYMNSDSESLIGWPPVHSWRKRFIEENHLEVEGVGFNGRVDEEGDQNFNVINNNNNNTDTTTTTTNNNNNNNNNQELFVKVKMDGVGITRKINLNGFRSYQMLYTTLIHMFDKYVEIEEDGASYKLMYQHQDGYWLLAGDIPWEMFIDTVKRIQMVRNSGCGSLK